MLPDNRQSEPWREALKFIGHCPVCNTAYEAARAKLFLKKKALNLVHITCTNCWSGFIAMVMIMGQGLSSVGMITDLSLEDAERIYGYEPITIDEVIEGYKFIQNNKII